MRAEAQQFSFGSIPFYAREGTLQGAEEHYLIGGQGGAETVPAAGDLTFNTELATGVPLGRADAIACDSITVIVRSADNSAKLTITECIVSIRTANPIVAGLTLTNLVPLLKIVQPVNLNFGAQSGEPRVFTFYHPPMANETLNVAGNLPSPVPGFVNFLATVVVRNSDGAAAHNCGADIWSNFRVIRGVR